MKFRNILVVICIILLFVACPQPTDDNSSGGNNDNNSSPPSDDYKVDDLTASKMEHTDKIELTWGAVTGVDSYKIYRYTSKSDINPISYSEVSSPYADADTNEDTPYYYKIACIKDSTEYAVSDNYIFGIYNANVDVYEDNDDETSNILTPTLSETAIIYSTPVADEVETDTDWYKYSGKAVPFFVNLESVNIDEFSTGKLKIKFKLNGNYVDEEEEYLNFNVEGEEQIEFNSYDGIAPTEDVEVFFKIYVEDIDDSKPIIEKYKLEVGNL